MEALAICSCRHDAPGPNKITKNDFAKTVLSFRKQLEGAELNRPQNGRVAVFGFLIGIVI
jgi:hypothetical protein